MTYLIIAISAAMLLGGLIFYRRSSRASGLSPTTTNGSVSKIERTTTIELQNGELYELEGLSSNDKASFIVRGMGHKTPMADGSSPVGNNALASLKLEYRGKSLETIITEGSRFTLQGLSGKIEQLGSDGESATIFVSFIQVHD